MIDHLSRDVAADDFGDVTAQWTAIRSAAALHSLAHWQWFVVRGSDHLEFLHRMCTNTIVDKKPGEHVEIVFTDARGRIIERVDLCRVAEDFTLLILGPGSAHTLPTWLDRYIFGEEIEFVDPTADDSMIEILGPQAEARLRDHIPECTDHACGVTEAGLMFARSQWAGVSTIRLAGPSVQLEQVWNSLAKSGTLVTGERGWQLQRVSHGTPLRQVELTDAHNPWESHLHSAIDLNKGCYIGQEVIARLEAYDKIKQTLVGLSLPCHVDQGTRLASGDREVGYVSSCIPHPDGQYLGLGYVRNAYVSPGAELMVAEHGTCQIATLPKP